MQTFLPYSDFNKVASVLDMKRLNKQRVEAMQLINAITAIENNDLYIIDKNGKRRKRGWLKHPATLMWFQYKEALKLYHNIMIKEWIRRGYKNNMKLFDINSKKLKYPDWLGDEQIHASHRSNLLRKNKEYYSKFDWHEPDDMPYVWPVG